MYNEVRCFSASSSSDTAAQQHSQMPVRGCEWCLKEPIIDTSHAAKLPCHAHRHPNPAYSHLHYDAFALVCFSSSRQSIGSFPRNLRSSLYSSYCLSFSTSNCDFDWKPVLNQRLMPASPRQSIIPHTAPSLHCKLTLHTIRTQHMRPLSPTASTALVQRRDIFQCLARHLPVSLLHVRGLFLRHRS